MRSMSYKLQAMENQRMTADEVEMWLIKRLSFTGLNTFIMQKF